MVEKAFQGEESTDRQTLEVLKVWNSFFSILGA